MALLAVFSLYSTTALAAPREAESVQAAEEAKEAEKAEETVREEGPFGTSYLIKGAVVVGVGVVFYTVLVIQTRKKK